MFPNLFSRASAPGSRLAWVLSVPSSPCSPPPLLLSSTSSPLRLAPSLTADLEEAIKAFGGCAQLGRLRGAKSQFLVFSLLHLSLGPNRFGSFKGFVSPRNLSHSSLSLRQLTTGLAPLTRPFLFLIMGPSLICFCATQLC